MPDYIDHLAPLYQKNTFSRKVDYLNYNIGKILSKAIKKGGDVLEIGPGMGEMVYYLNKKKFFNIDILDVDKSVLDYVSSRFKVRKSYTANIERLTNKVWYDSIVAIQVLEHLPVERHPKVLGILFKRLRKNGELIFVVPNSGNPLGIVERYADLQHTTSFTEQSVKDLIRESGISSYKLIIGGYRIPPYNITNVLRIILQKSLHILLTLTLIVNGGIFFRTLTPNLMFIVRKTRNEK